MSIGLLGWLFSLTFAGLAALLVYLCAPGPDIESLLESESKGTKIRKKRSLLLSISFPLILIIAEFTPLITTKRSRERLEKRLIEAGKPGGLSVDQYNATRILIVILGVFIGMFFDAEVDLWPIVTIGMGLLGYFYPDIWLNDRTAFRRRRIFRELPEVLDKLRLAVEAGFDLGSALQATVEQEKDTPLYEELEAVSRDISLGRTRQEAFRNFAARVAMPEINGFVMALIQADQLGASIGPVLKTQSDMARIKRWNLAEELVNKMPMKMLGPLVLFIFPSSFIILFTPLLIQWMQSG